MSKSQIRAFATGLVLIVWSAMSAAAGLGKLTVLSALGQPFLAEIDLVSVKKDEASSLSARLASPDAFRQAELPFTAYVSNLKLSIERRPNGEAFVKVASAQPLNEPFIDFLVELRWTSGRLVRAYTALVDPAVLSEPQTAATAAQSPEVVAAPAAEPPLQPPVPGPAEGVVEPPLAEAEAPVVVGEAPEEPPAVAAPAAEQQAGAVAQVPEPAEQVREIPAPAAVAPSVPAGTEVVTRRGDTLWRIAQENKPADITVDQMLVMLFRSNPDAFSGENMNRLKTGKVLRIPEAQDYADLGVAEARREVRVQAANWNAYRERLAGLVAGGAPSEGVAGRSAAGAVTTTVEEKALLPGEQPADVLRLSKGEPARGAGAGAAGDAGGMKSRIQSLEEEVAAKEKAVREANERIAQLEKTIKDMQSLMDIKAGGVAAGPGPGATAGAPQPEAAAAGAEASTGTASEEGGAASETAPAPTVAEPAPAATEQKPKFVPPPPPPAPSLVDEILAEPLYLAGGAIVLVALGGLGFLSWKRRRAAAQPAREEATTGNEAASEPAAAEPEAFLAGGTGTGSAEEGAEEGDALAEAEIFLTYGRDNLAEERLKEAVAANPNRLELHAKLLEIYAKRKDPAAFERVAKELQMATGGKGEIWNQAVRLGYQIDPANPRYAAGRPTEGEDLASTVVGAAGTAAAALPLMSDSTNLDFNLGLEGGATGTTTDIDLGNLNPEIGVATTAITPMDIDLGTLEEGEELSDSIVLDPGERPVGDNVETVQMNTVDEAIRPGETAPASGGLDLDFDLSGITPPTAAGASAAPGHDTEDFGLDLDLGDLSIEPPQAAGESPGADAPELDLSGISLDLGGGTTSVAGGPAKDDRWYDVQTKFDLAKAYQEMGDREGAREILQEVITEGDDEQKAAAQAALATLA